MRYNYYFSVYCFLLYVVANTYNPAYADQQEPLSNYQQYLKDLPVKPVEYLLENYWSSEVVTHGLVLLADISAQNSLQRESFIFFVKFPLQMQAIFFMEQALQKDTACLLVTGQADNYQSVAFNIRYLLENGTWRIHAVRIKNYAKKQLMPSSPHCDSNNR